MSTPSISVIIPTYNRAELVPLAIDSVLAQTQPAAEIIIVDDGSSEDMRVVLAKYGSAIRVIRQTNAGVSAARNTGIRAARHDWIAFLDDDDEHTPDRLARAAESIRRHPSADIHVTNIAIISPTGPEVDLFAMRGLIASEWMKLDHPLKWVLEGCFFVQSAVIRRQVLEEVGLFRNGINCYEDLDLFVRLVSRKPWIVDSKACLRLIRRANTSNLSHDHRSKFLVRYQTLVSIYRHAGSLPNLKPSEIQQVRTNLGTYQFELGTALLDLGQAQQARQQFLEAAQTFPSAKSRLKARVVAIFGKAALLIIQKLRKPTKGFVR